MAGPGSGRGQPRGVYVKPKDAGATAWRLLGYLSKRKLPLVFVLLCLLVSVATNVGGSYYMRPIVNHLTAGDYQGPRDLLTALFPLAGLYLAGAAASYLQMVIMARLAQKGVNRLRRELFDRLQRLPLSFFDQNPHGELMSRFTNDADHVQTALEQSIVSLFSSVFTFVGVVAMMIFIHPLLFLITLFTLVGTFFIFTFMGGRSRTYYRAQQANLGKVNGNIQEMIEGLKVVKAFTHEEQAKAIFAALNEAYRESAVRANFFSSAVMPITMNLNHIGYAVTAAAGGLFAIVGGFDLGGFTTYLNYSRQVSQPMNQISQQISAVFSALAGAERIFAVMDAEPEPDAGKVTLEKVGERDWVWKKPDGSLVPLRGDVRLVNVDFSYVPDKPILHNVSVYAKPGQKIAFVGSTGAGKTTITNLINRFYEIQGGSITYDGIDVRDIAKDDLRRSLGAVLQDTHLFTGTVMENLRYGRPDATDEECIRAAKTAGAHSLIRRLPDGYNTVVTEDGANLSQGQRQLIAIARAAVADPPVMVLDEATSSIDTRTEAQIQKGMDALMEGRTVFVIAHRLSTVRDADCIVVIEHGGIVEKGSHTELLQHGGRYYQLYTGQFRLD